MITREQYMMGRDTEYPTTEQLEINAAILLFRVNRLLRDMFPGVTNWINESGYRPGRHNAKYSPGSAHVTCEAIDLGDVKGTLKKALTPEILEKYDLYMEHPSATPTWCHLTKRAPKSGRRIFYP